MTTESERPEPSRRQRRADRKRAKALTAAALEGGASAAAAEQKRGRAFRWPAVLVVIAALVGAFIVQERVRTPSTTDISTADPGRLMPTATPAAAQSSIWFCAGGTGTGDPNAVPGPSVHTPPASTPGTAPSTSATSTPSSPSSPSSPSTAVGATSSGSTPSGSSPIGTVPATAGSDSVALDAQGRPIITAEHRVQIANLSDKFQSVKVTVYPSTGEAISRNFDVGGNSRIDVTLSDVVKAPFVSALVEANAGLVAVSHLLVGPTGTSAGPCASSPSATWYFAAGSTSLGTREVFVAFNPYPERAVIDFSFAVEEEGGRSKVRDTDKLKGLVVPANGVTAVDITDIIAVRPQVSTFVQTRGGNGRVVIDRVISSDGSNGPKSLNVNLGAPTPVNGWMFADGPVLEPGVTSDYVLYNPGPDTIEADVVIEPDGRSVVAEATPFEVTIRPGQFERVEVGRDNRVPNNSRYWVAVQARGGGTLVAERVVRAQAPAARVGTSYTLGSPLLARQWLVPAARLVNQRFGEVSIANPIVDRSVTLTVRVVGGGESAPLQAFDRVELPGGRRTVVDLGAILAPGADASVPRSLVIESSGPVVVEQVVGFADPSSLPDAISIPVRDTLSFPPPAIAAGVVLPSVPGAGVPGTGPVGTARGTLPISPPGSGTAPPTETPTDPNAPPATNEDGTPVSTTAPPEGPAPVTTAAPAAGPGD